MHPQVAIIVLNWNGLTDTLECVDSVLKLTYPNWRLILIDNGSRDPNDVIELQRRWGNDARITVVCNEKNLGFTGGMNQGVELALEDPDVHAVFLLNNDAVVEPEALTRLVSAWGRDPWIGGVGAALQEYNQREVPNSWGLTMTRSGLSFNVTAADQIFFGPSGGAVLYPRRFIEYVLTTDGYFFDPDFFAYCEDLDLAFRGRWYGFTFLHEPMARVYHKVSRSTGRGSHFSMEHYLRNGLWVLVKNWTGGMWLRWGTYVVASRLAFLPLYVWRRSPLVPLRAYWRALRGLRPLLVRRRVIQFHRTAAPRGTVVLHGPTLANWRASSVSV